MKVISLSSGSFTALAYMRTCRSQRLKNCCVILYSHFRLRGIPTSVRRIFLLVARLVRWQLCMQSKKTVDWSRYETIMDTPLNRRYRVSCTIAALLLLSSSFCCPFILAIISGNERSRKRRKMLVA